MFKLKSFALLAALAVMVFGAASQVRAQDDDEAGGYVAADTDSAPVRAAAAFAVKERGRVANAAIGLVEIKSAQQQVVAGVNYQLCMLVTVRPSGATQASRQYVTAVVYQNLQNAFKLSSWVVGNDCPDE